MHSCTWPTGSRKSSCEAAPPVTGKRKPPRQAPILFISEPRPLSQGPVGRHTEHLELSVLNPSRTQKGSSLLALCRDLGRSRQALVFPFGPHIYFSFDFSASVHSCNTPFLSYREAFLGKLFGKSQIYNAATVAFCFIKE